MSRPLRSTTTPASSSFTANTSRSASKRRDRYSMPPVSAVGTLPLAARQGPAGPDGRFDARLLTFHARAADQDHAASTPDTAWPGTRDPARLISRIDPVLGFDAISTCFDASTRRPTEHQPGADDSGTSSWSPPDAINAAPSPNAHHDSLQPTQLEAGLTPIPAGPTSEGQQSSPGSRREFTRRPPQIRT